MTQKMKKNEIEELQIGVLLRDFDRKRFEILKKDSGASANATFVKQLIRKAFRRKYPRKDEEFRMEEKLQ